MAVRVITLCFLLFFSLAAFTDTLTGKVVKIMDGDTLYVLDAMNNTRHMQVGCLPKLWVDRPE